MELYVAYKDYQWMMDLVEEMVERVAMDLHGTTEVKVGEHLINFQRPWKRISMFEAIQEFTGVDISEMDEAGLRATCDKMGIEVAPSLGKGKLIDEIFGAKCEPFLIQPTFITDYPVEMSPLAKKHRNKPGLVERFEAICNGKEICNAFSELNDPLDQRARFEEQLELGKRGDDEAMVLDEDFLRALEFGMPPTAGLGIGIDRLSMIMTNSASIQEVLFFPQMKPEKQFSQPQSKDFEALGAGPGIAKILASMNFQSMEDFKAASPNKIFNDMGGLRKKLKVEEALPSLDLLKSWMGQG
jgi:lysyl-tRNA synthetase class 2